MRQMQWNGGSSQTVNTHENNIHPNVTKYNHSLVPKEKVAFTSNSADKVN